MNLRKQLDQISIKYQNGGTVNIVDRSGNKVVLNTDSEQYRKLYESRQIQGYDSKTNTYYLTPSHEKVVYKSTNTVPSNQIEEVALKGKKADWVKYKEDYIKNNPKEKFIQEYLDAYPWAHQSLNNYPKRLDEDYENRVNDYIGKQIVKNKPQGDKSREDWLNSLSEKEQRFVQRNPKYNTSLWQDTVEGGKALFNLSNDLQISRIENSDNYTNLEKKDLIEEHNKNPILSNISDITQVLSPLTVPSKMVQSVYRPEYSIKDAIYGTKNKASMLEDIATDPLNLVGAEFFNKFDDINKIIKPLKNTVEMFPKSSNIFVKVNKESGESLFNKLFNKKIPFIQNMDDYKDYIDVLRKEEIDYINSPEYFKLRGDNTGETSTQILKSVDKMKKNMDRTSYNITHRLNPNSGEYLNSISTFFSPKKGKLLPSLDFNPSINIGDSRYSETIEGTLSHEIKHGYSPVGTDLGIYRNYPTLKVKIPENKPFEYYLSRPYEQQVRFNKIKSTLQKDLGVKRGTPITEEHLNYYFNKPYDVRIDGDAHELFNNLDDSVTKHDALDVLNKAWSVIPIAGGIGYEALNSEDETPKYQNGGVTDREIQVLKNTAKDNVNQSKQFELEYLNSPKFKERAIKAGYDYNTLKKQLYKNISTQKTNFYNDNGKTNGAFFNPSDNSLNFGISKNEDFEDGLINVNGDTVAHEIGHQFSNGKNLDMTKQRDLLEKSNFLLPKDFIGKVKRGYEIATNPDYYQEDGHETFNSETIADIHSARKELFDKTGIDLRYSNMTDEAFNIMLKDAFKRKENSFERIFSKIGKDKNKEILNDYFFKSTDPNEIDQIYKKYNTDEKIQKLKKDAEKAMRDNKDVIMNLMNRVVDNKDNNEDLFYAQEGGSLNNIRNTLTSIYNKYE